MAGSGALKYAKALFRIVPECTVMALTECLCRFLSSSIVGLAKEIPEHAKLELERFALLEPVKLASELSQQWIVRYHAPKYGTWPAWMRVIFEDDKSLDYAIAGASQKALFPWRGRPQTATSRSG